MTGLLQFSKIELQNSSYYHLESDSRKTDHDHRTFSRLHEVVSAARSLHDDSRTADKQVTSCGRRSSASSTKPLEIKETRFNRVLLEGCCTGASVEKLNGLGPVWK